MTADPTLEFVSRLADPTKWVIRRGVPIFKAHEIAFPETTLSNGQTVPARVNKVTAEDLPVIAANMQKSERSGTYALIREGHINPDPNAKEATQPTTMGVYINPRAGTFGPDNEPGVLADEYLLPEHASKRSKYPHRSSEYYAGAKTIKGVALLARPPALDLGMVGFQAGGEVPYLFSMGAMGATDAGGPDGDSKPGGDAKKEDFSPEQKALYEGLCRYLRQQYGLPDDWPTGTDKQPEGDTVADDKTPKGGDKGGAAVTPMQSPEAVALYAQFETFKGESIAREGTLRAELDGLRAERAVERCQAMLFQALPEQVYRLSADERSKETAKLVKLPDADRAERLAELPKLYAERAVPQGRLDLYQGTHEASAADPKDPYAAPWYHEPAKEYMYSHPGMQYAAAVQHVKDTAAKK